MTHWSCLSRADSLRLVTFEEIYSPNLTRNEQMLYQEGSESGLERLLPNTVSAHMAQVFFTRGQPHLLFIVASTSAAYTYSTLDATYLSNIGSVLLASLARARMEEQDAAKTG